MQGNQYIYIILMHWFQCYLLQRVNKQEELAILSVLSEVLIETSIALSKGIGLYQSTVGKLLCLFFVFCILQSHLGVVGLAGDLGKLCFYIPDKQ